MSTHTSIFRTTVFRIVLLFLCSLPVFYLDVFLALQGKDLPYLYVACRGLRFLAVVLIAWSIRQKSRDALRTEPKSARFTWILLGLLCVSLALHVMDITPKLYFSISSTLGIYGARTVPLFLAVLWEQFLSGDFFWAVLLGLTIVCFTAPKPGYQTSPNAI